MTAFASLARALGCGLLLLTVTGKAGASATYPEALRNELGLAAIAGPAPGCRLCHQDDVGGLKTATKPLGRALIAAGASGANIPSLLAALEALEDEHTDSDHDGSPDIDELRAGTDPNVAVGMDGNVIPQEEIPLPETGCALARRPHSSVSAALLLLLAVSLVRRRLSAGLASRARAAYRRAR